MLIHQQRCPLRRSRFCPGKYFLPAHHQIAQFDAWEKQAIIPDQADCRFRDLCIICKDQVQALRHRKTVAHYNKNSKNSRQDMHPHGLSKRDFGNLPVKYKEYYKQNNRYDSVQSDRSRQFRKSGPVDQIRILPRGQLFRADDSFVHDNDHHHAPGLDGSFQYPEILLSFIILDIVHCRPPI